MYLKYVSKVMWAHMSIYRLALFLPVARKAEKMGAFACFGVNIGIILIFLNIFFYLIFGFILLFSLPPIKFPRVPVR